ncbi:MAG: GntR family transcriptional regulator [Gammaproteobacteria bacterium]|nr:GntR family transcriptional regulator [Gammaproteobacteria bacterium]
MNAAQRDSGTEPRRESDRSLTDRAYVALEEMICTLRLEPGEVLSEGALSETLGIGRTPVREALQRLAREGLVTVLPRRGVLVSEFNVKRQLRMLEVRRELERLMARSAASRATDEEQARFESVARAMHESADAGDDIGFMRLDHEFNVLVSQANRNEFASEAISLMAGLSRRFWFMHHRQAGDLSMIARLHADIAIAIASGDGAAAADASDALLDYIESITRAAVDW